MQKNHSNFLGQLQRDLKKYQGVVKQSTVSINENLAKLPEKDREILVNLQNKINDSVKTGSIKGAMESRDELMNYLKQQNGTSDSGSQS